MDFAINVFSTYSDDVEYKYILHLHRLAVSGWVLTWMCSVLFTWFRIQIYFTFAQIGCHWIMDFAINEFSTYLEYKYILHLHWLAVSGWALPMNVFNTFCNTFWHSLQYTYNVFSLTQNFTFAQIGWVLPWMYSVLIHMI